MRTQSLYGLISHSPIHASLDGCFCRAKCQAQPRDPPPLPHSVQRGRHLLSGHLPVTVGREGLHAEGPGFPPAVHTWALPAWSLLFVLSHTHLLCSIRVAGMQKRAVPRRERT